LLSFRRNIKLRFRQIENRTLRQTNYCLPGSRVADLAIEVAD